MRKLVPLKNSVVCRRINAKNELHKVGLVELRKNNVDLYEILDFSVDKDVDFDFKVGDVVMSCSTGDEMEINPGEIVFLFKTEHIMCKVCENER